MRILAFRRTLAARSQAIDRAWVAREMVTGARATDPTKYYEPVL